jgi:HEAT repeat protein
MAAQAARLAAAGLAVVCIVCAPPASTVVLAEAGDLAVVNKVAERPSETEPAATAPANFSNPLSKLLPGIRRWQFDSGPSELTEAEKVIRDGLLDQSKRPSLEAALSSLLEDEQATDAAKEWACWQLRMVGTAEAVPALAKLLGKPGLSHAARMALQQIPAAAAAQALRKALGQVQRDECIGIINSLGVRRDRWAVKSLITLSQSRDESIASAAVAALGQIGTPAAIQTLRGLVQSANPAVADALLLGADKLASSRKRRDAEAIYGLVFTNGNVPLPQRAAAARGLVLVNPQKAAARTLAFLQSPDLLVRGVAAGCVPQLPDAEAIHTLLRELPRLPVQTRIQVLAALADRPDPAVSKAILAAAEDPNKALRSAALRLVGKVEGTQEVVLRLLEAASRRRDEDQAAVREALARLRGGMVDPALTASCTHARLPVRREAMLALGDRGVSAAIPDILKGLNDPDTSARIAAWNALGRLADEDKFETLLSRFLRVTNAQERLVAERAMEAVTRRVTQVERAVEALAQAWLGATKENRLSLLAWWGALGGPKALGHVRDAIADSDPEVQNAAVRTLADWPEASALPMLEQLAGRARDENQRRVALRGFIRLVGLPATRAMDETVKLYAQAMSLARGPEDKKLVLAGIAVLAHPEALKLAEACLAEPALAQEAAKAAEQIKTALTRSRSSAK